MIIFTSNFQKHQNHHNACAISRTVPADFTKRRFIELAPTWDLLSKWMDKKITKEEYKEEYTLTILNTITPEMLNRYMLERTILLCWENPKEFCHRHIVSDWLRSKGFKSHELGNKTYCQINKKIILPNENE
jgi:hypothetical protein